MNRVLLIAFHYPPCSGSSGLLRSLKFSRYLPEFGWQPIVLTVRPSTYAATDSASADLIPEGVPILRSFAFDIKKAFAFAGFYPDCLAIPDRWGSWLLGALPSGVRAIRENRADIIFSTFPISTAVLVGFFLHLLTGKPWVADFRDSMTEECYPRERWRRSLWRWTERQAVRHASRLIFTAASTRAMYLERYPDLSPEKCLLIPNGYDEEDFHHIIGHQTLAAAKDRPLRLLHTGIIYPEERDPRPFFRALSLLKREGKIGAESVRIIFRAAGSEDLYRKIVGELDIADLIELLPHVPYRQALQECADADGLLLFQAANCDHQIPAKTYEYLRLQKPIFALTSHTGDTAALLRKVSGATIVNLADQNDIHRDFPLFLNALRTQTHAIADARKIAFYARRNQAGELAKCLSELAKQAHSASAEKTQALHVEG